VSSRAIVNLRRRPHAAHLDHLWRWWSLRRRNRTERRRHGDSLISTSSPISLNEFEQEEPWEQQPDDEEYSELQEERWQSEQQQLIDAAV